MHQDFIERNEGGSIKQEVLKAIAEIEKETNLDKLTIEELVEKIAESDYLEDSFITSIGQISIIYAYFKHLIKRVSVQKLEELSNHPNYIVQCYAFVGLTHRGSKNLFKIVLSKLHISNNMKIRGLGYRGRIKVADFFLNEGIPFLTEEQSDMIVDESLNNNYDFLFLPEYFRNIFPEEKNYERIKKCVVEYRNIDALVAIAKFQKENDINIIKDFSQHEPSQFLWAVEHFPHLSFWKDLMDIHEKSLKGIDGNSPNNRNLYRTIAVYHNSEALEVLTSTFDRITDDYLLNSYAHIVFLAVRDYQDGFYDQLFLILWREYSQINLEIFDYLLKNYESLAFDLIKHSLSDPDKFYKVISHFDNFKDSLIGPEKLAAKMIRKYIKRDKKNAFKAIMKNIVLQNVTYLHIFTKKASELLEDAFIDPLFQRFSFDKNYHVYCEIAQCLLKYDLSEINERLLGFYRNKSYLQRNTELTKIFEEARLI